MGSSTADSTRAIPTSAPWICSIERLVASLGGKPSSDITRSTFSTTTMASSTRIPMARTMPNRVSTLTEKPSESITAKVPISATGTTRVGIRV
ncbi:hypothetical protein D9M71_434560 [compost metagenome]